MSWRIPAIYANSPAWKSDAKDDESSATFLR
jgi:hypothetical protein